MLHIIVFLKISETTVRAPLVKFTFVKGEFPLECFPGKFPKLLEQRFLGTPHGDCSRKTPPSTENMTFSKFFDLLSLPRRIETKEIGVFNGWLHEANFLEYFIFFKKLLNVIVVLICLRF